MAKTLFTIILLLACSAKAMAYDFKVDGLCYDICTLSAVGINLSPMDSLFKDTVIVSEAPIIAPERKEVEEPFFFDDNYVYGHADVEPQFPGGDEALLQCIQNNLHYPKAASNKGVEGTVVVEFIVEKDGSVGEIRLVKGIDFDLDHEAMRLCKVLPKFSPARNNNEPVRMWYTIPIRFKITDRPDPDPNIIEDAQLGDVIAQHELGYYYYLKDDYAQAISWMQKAASQGDEEALDLLPTLFALNKDYKQATEWYKKTRLTDEDFNMNTGELLYVFAQNLTPLNEDRKTALLTDAADMGSTDAMLDLMEYYTSPYSSHEDKAKAVHYYRLYKKHMGEPYQNITIADVYYYLYSKESDSENDYSADSEKSDLKYEYLAKAAEAGHPNALTRMGNLYYNRDQFDKAADYYEQAMKLGSIKALFNLGTLYAEGKGVERDSVICAQLVGKAARAGDADAQNYLATCYYIGYGVQQDRDMAIHWLIKAAEQGHHGATQTLINSYEVGDGQKAINLYRNEAENGHDSAQDMWGDYYYSGNASAQNIMGNCYYYGDGVELNYDQAIYWYKEAAKHNNNARLNLAKLYARIHDYENALKWLHDYETAEYLPRTLAQDTGDLLNRIAYYIYPNMEYLDFLNDAASLGHSKSLRDLACIYALGKDVKRDDSRAIDLYRHYLDLESKDEYTLNRIHLEPQNVNISDIYDDISYHRNDIISQQRGGNGDEWRLKAAELGNHSAIWNTVRELEGQEDYNQAIKWLLKLAQQEDSVAQCLLADYYENGKGVTPDHRTAIEWYMKAADLGHPYAQNIIGECYLKGDVLTRDPQKAVEMFTKSISSGHNIENYRNYTAFYNLGICYYEGLGVDQDFNEAASLFDAASPSLYAPDLSIKTEKTLLFNEIQKDFDDKELVKQACYYALGKDVERNVKKAVKLLRQYLGNINKSNINVTLADVHYIIHENYYSIMKIDYSDEEIQSQIQFHLEESAHMGLAEAQYELGEQYEQHAFQGHSEEYQSAAIWFKKAAEQGYMDAQYHLALLYEYGNGVPQDDHKAFELYKKAADQGHIQALWGLGDYYTNGKAGIKDPKLANECFYKLATAYKARAEEILKQMKEMN